MKITATIDGRIKTITEASIRRHLKLEDSDELNRSGYRVNSPKEPASMPHDSPLPRVQSLRSVEDEGTSWIQEDYKIQGRTSADAKILLDQKEPTKLVEDLGSGEKGEKEICTVIPKVSIAAENLVYIKRSVEKRKDKRKAIMKEDKSVQKKSKKQLEQERLGHEEAIRLQEQIFKEESTMAFELIKFIKSLLEE
nr:hypothetical protein [Tanacetum cinerariifolium]